MREINENIIAETLVIGRGLTDETFTKGIRHGVKIPEFKTGISDIYDVISAMQNFIVRMADGNSALLLSGGKDSRVIAALMKHAGVSPVCITFSYNESDPEVRAARQVCRKLKFEHKFVKIDPIKYFENHHLIDITDGNPNYFPMMLFYSIIDELDYNVVFTGELMTEFMDTGEYRWYEGDIRYALAKKEMLLPVVDAPFYTIILTKLLSMYNNDINRVIVERKLDRLIYLKLWKKYINFAAPATDEKVLSAVLSLPLNNRISSRLTRNILRIINSELLKLPTARSPFSLRFPLWFHQVYQKLTNRVVGIGGYMPSFIADRYSIDELADVDLAFIDKNRVRAALSGRWGDRARNAAYERMLNLKVWMDNNGY